MTGPIKRRNWTPVEIDLMFEMVAGCQARGVKTEWRKISKAVGHKSSNCHVKFDLERGRRANAATIVTSADAARDEYRVRGRIESKPRVENPEYLRSTSTAKLVMDAELRSRIAVLGATGGLLGDPLPGRSALDQKRAGL